MSERMGTWAMVGRMVLVSALAVQGVGCDESKAIHDRAVTLEAEGKAAQAADQLDLVCERAPKSELCAPSRVRAAELRLTAAKALVAEHKYEEANALLARVAAGSAPEAQKSAKELADSPEMVNGLKWERASKLSDDRAKFDIMLAVYFANVAVSPKAKAWMDTFGIPFRLEIVKEACAAPAQPNCLGAAESLAKEAPKSPEAAEAQRIHDAYVTSEQARLVSLLGQLEPLVAECAGLWKKDKVFQSWAPKRLARLRWRPNREEPHGPIVGTCQCETSLDTCAKVKEVESRAAAVRRQMLYRPLIQKTRLRMDEACYGGEYTKDVPKPPAARDMHTLPDFVD